MVRAIKIPANRLLAKTISTLTIIAKIVFNRSGLRNETSIIKNKKLL